MPLVVRMEGTNVEQGKQILADSGLDIIAAERHAGRRARRRSRRRGRASMSVLVDKNTRVLIQGITGATGQLHTRLCREYGTQMVAGVTPGRGGTDFEGIPIFDTVAQAVAKTGANASVIFVPPPARPTPSSRPPTPASRSSSASPRASRCSTWCA